MRRSERARNAGEYLEFAHFLGGERLRKLGIPQPPAPKGPASLRGLPPNQQRKSEEADETASFEWSESLSKSQRTALKQAWTEAYKAMEQEAKAGGKAVRLMSSLESLPDPSSGYSWRDEAGKRGLSPDEIERLNRDKILIEDLQLEQSFKVYVEGGPFFITSDSLLNGFHVLFEDSFRELEFRRVPKLRDCLEQILKNTRLMAKSSTAPGISIAVAWRQAQLVMGPAMRLLGSSADLFDFENRAEIERQVALIRAADHEQLPPWLGPPSRTLLTIDYHRFRPTGFYADDYYLADYFRAVRWLQVVPFRADRDQELLGILLLGRATDGDIRPYVPNMRGTLEAYSRWLGSEDGRDLFAVVDQFRRSFPHQELTQGMLTDTRRELLPSADSNKRYSINEGIRLPPNGARTLEEVQFHILRSYQLPETEVFQRLADASEKPSGLNIAALLGSSLAKRLVAATGEPGPLAHQRSLIREEWAGERQDIYTNYLQVLSALFAPPEPDAPEFMRNEAWAAKSCQTVLAGWAQMRHTFSLQAKMSENYLFESLLPPGFVEPNPLFFARVAHLCARIQDELEEGGAFFPSNLIQAEEIREDASWIEEVSRKNPKLSGSDFGWELGMTYRAMVYGDECRKRGVDSDKLGSEALQEFNRKLVAEMRAKADALAAGKSDLPSESSLLRERWQRLERMARQLEAMAQKQLRRQPWTLEEAAFIKGYGEALGFVMGYYGNSWGTPKDDAPRWVEIHRDPNIGKSLAVGVGRPRPIYVLYPWNGGEILCRGSVMSYYEYWETGHLTDEEWKAKLDSKDAPPMPSWIMPLVAK